MTDAAPPIWLPPKPGIIRPATADLLKYVSPYLGLLGFTPSVLAQKREQIEPFSLAYVPASIAVTTIDNNPLTFTSRPFGDAPIGGNKRYIVVFVTGAAGNAIEISGVTIAGITATQVVKVKSSAAGASTCCGIYIAEVPTGTSGTVVVTYSTTATKGSVGVYRMMNPGSATAHHTASAGTHASGVLNLSLNIPAGGKAIGGISGQNNSTTTWTGLNEDYDLDSAEDDFVSAASGGAPGTPHTIRSTDADTTPGQLSGVAASWGP